MNTIEKDVEKFLELINSTEKGWNEEKLKKIAYGIIFFKYIENSTSKTHYLNSLVQDSLSIIDSLSQRSQRYYYFILRSYIENFMRVLLSLENEDSMGVMKLFKNSKRLLESIPEAAQIFEEIENQYDECCLFVHSNIKADTEINVYLQMILDRNDFEESLKVNVSLEKFENILNNSIKVFLMSCSQTVDNAFYRKKDILKLILSDENYHLFTSSLG